MQPIPDRLVVLTFDDGRRSDVELVGPLLARHGFGATFYVTEGLGFEDKSRFLTWDEIRWLHDAGFEIGNHHGRHVAVETQTRAEFERDLRHMEESCAAHGIPTPVTYCYPGGHHCRTAVEALHDAGYLFARRCGSPEHVDHAEGAFGRAYDPEEDHPLLIPTAGIGGPAMDLDDLRAAVSTARDGRIAVICLHGVPDDHPFCSTTPALFERFVDYLAGNEYTVIALRDLARYVDPWQRPADPYAAIEARLYVRPCELTCGYTDTPGVEDTRPRFHWVLASDQRGQWQSAYRVLVASRRELLQPGRADRWDSGRVETGVNDRPCVTYGGQPLDRGEVCWWTVRCWDAGGRPGPWAEPERFDTTSRGLEDSTGSGAEPDARLGIEVPYPAEPLANAAEVRIRPRLLDGVTRAAGSVRTVRGRVAVSWERAAEAVTTLEAFALQVTLPAGTRGRVTVPTLDLPAFRIDEHGAPVWRHGSARVPRPWQVEGVGTAIPEDGGVTFQLGSGDYRFRVTALDPD